MQDNLYSVLTLLEAKPGMEETLGKSLALLIEPTLQENGCINYQLHRCQSGTGRYFFYENWSNAQAFTDHLNSKHIQSWLANQAELLAKPLDVTFWEPCK